jgi:hypothetical protein
MRRPPPPFLDRTWIPLPTERAVILGFDVTPPSGTVVMVVKQEVFHRQFLVPKQFEPRAEELKVSTTSPLYCEKQTLARAAGMSQ